ncbi:LemA family protein [bacterium]|nr:LemA family protein [bacterium]
MVVYIIMAVIILLIVYIFVLYNSFVSLNNKVKEAFATMDVYLKKRWDLIPNLVETVKGYANHEQETFSEVTKLRNSNYESMSNEEKIITNEKMNTKIDRIMALKQAYPELKANENFKDLSEQLKKIEDDIANSRKYYNAVVRVYNNKVEMFPNSLIAKIFGYHSKKMFEAKNEERKNVKVEL